MHTKINSFKKILKYYKAGANIRTRSNLFYLSIFQLAIFPIKYFSKDLHNNLFSTFAGLNIKNGQIKLFNKLFFISKRGDYLLLISEEDITELLRKNEGKVFIDIGAHMGKYPILVGDKYRKVIAVEAQKNNFSFLRKNIGANNLSKKIIAVHKAAFWKNIKQQKLYIQKDTSAGHTLIKDFDKKSLNVEFVDTITVDELLYKFKIDPKDVDFVKIDVEGVEFDVLRGMKQTLSEGHAQLIIEIWDDNKKSFANIKNILKQHGYNIKKLNGDNWLAEK